MGGSAPFFPNKTHYKVTLVLVRSPFLWESIMNRTTSRLAYNELKHSDGYKNQKDIIIEILELYPNGLSLREICEKTGFDINAVSGRVNDLKKTSILEEIEKRKCSITNRLINAVAIKTSFDGDQGSLF